MMNKIDEQLYEQVAAELLHRDVSPGLWAKSIEDARGNSAAVEAIYIGLRVKQLKGELSDRAQSARQLEKQVRAERLEAERMAAVRSQELKRQGIYKCNQCGFEGNPLSSARGSFLVGLALVGVGFFLVFVKANAILAFLPFAIYCLYKAGYDVKCPTCSFKLGRK